MAERLSADDLRRRRVWRQLKHMLESSASRSSSDRRRAAARSKPHWPAGAGGLDFFALDASDQLHRARRLAARRRDLHTVSRLNTPEGVAAFLWRQRQLSYASCHLRRTSEHGAGGLPQTEIATQTEPTSEPSEEPSEEPSDGTPGEMERATSSTSLVAKSCDLLARDEQSLENLAEADLAYLEMVRTKSDLHHPPAGESFLTVLNFAPPSTALPPCFV